MPGTTQRAATIGLGLIALGLLFDGTANAQTVGGWGPRQFCTTRFGGPPTCAYTTWEQCLATIRGTGLNCVVNPYFTGAPARAEAPRTRRHRTRNASQG
jgi:hypothetical protein